MSTPYDQASAYLSSLQAHLFSIDPSVKPSANDLTTYLVLLKLVHRLASTHIVQSKAETAELRNALDKLVLEENGLEYEKKRLGQEIEKCLHFEQDSFQKLGIQQQRIDELVAMPDVTLHQLILQLLQEEREHVSALSVKKNRLDKEILTQQREVEKLKLELSGVDGKMEDLLEVARSVKEGLTSTLS